MAGVLLFAAGIARLGRLIHFVPYPVTTGFTAGIGVVITFTASAPGNPQIGILNCEEGRYVDGKWQHLRWLNGDQTHQGRHIRLPPGQFQIQKVRLYRYR